jgi:hypothetical protein
VHITNLS